MTSSRSLHPFWLLLLWTACLLPGLSVQAQQDTPAVPSGEPAQQVAQARLDSPQALMREFLTAVAEARQEQADEAVWQRVSATLGLPDLAPEQARTTAVQLLEVLDKLGTVNLDALPDAQRVREAGVQRYIYFPYGQRDNWVYEELKAFGRWPQGSIVMAQQADGQWRFSASTVAGIGQLHQSMEPLPPRHIVPQPGDEEPEFVGILGKTLVLTPWWGWATLLLDHPGGHSA